MPKPENLVVRPAREPDIEPVAAIEAESFASPWGADLYGQEFGEPMSVFLVAELAGQLAGYVSARAIFEDGHIMKIAVRKDLRGLGIAGFMMERVMDEFSRRKVEMVWLEVRKSNLAARDFYEKMGFNEVSVRRRYYADTGEDAIVMMKRMDK